MRLDAIDRRILRALQRDGRVSNVELAAEVGLSPSPCLRRVKNLEDAGILTGYTAVLDADRLGLPLSVFVRVSLKTQDEETIRHFADAMQPLDLVQECYLVAGECDFVLRVVAPSIEAYRQFQADHITSIDGVAGVKTDIPVEKVKVNLQLPLTHTG